MDPEKRILLKVTMNEEESSEIDLTFTTLMGDKVEPRKEFIEANAKYLPEGYEQGGRKNFMKWPEEDDFVIHVASQVIREHAPEVMFVHIVGLSGPLYRRIDGRLQDRRSPGRYESDSGK